MIERTKLFEGETRRARIIVDDINDAINRNSQQFSSFLTSNYGINMQENPDALLVIKSGTDILVYPGKAISPNFNLIINGSNYNINALVAALYGGNPDPDAKAYVYITKKEIYDDTSTVEFLPGYSSLEPYEAWNIGFEIKVEETQSAPDTDAILLAQLTYSGGVWIVSEDYRLLTQFSLTSGLAELLDHIFSAHTACLYPEDSTALRSTINGTTLEFSPLTVGEDYVYSGGEIYTSLKNESFNFSGQNTGKWYYVYVKDQDLEVIAAGDSTPPGLPLSLSDIGLDDEKYLVLCYVWYSGGGVLTNNVDLIEDYLLATRADQIRVSPSGTMSSKDAQSAIMELANEKISKDGSISMSGNLNMGYRKIINVQDIIFATDPANGQDPHIVQSDSKPIYINATAALTKGLRLNSSGEVYIKGEVQTDINMVDGATVDGVDISKLNLGQVYDWVVDRNGDEGPGPSSTGTVGIDYAFSRCQSTAGLSVFFKNFDAGYELGASYTFQPNTTIIGENSDLVKINFEKGANKYHLYFGGDTAKDNYFDIEGLTFIIPIGAVEDLLKFYDKGTLRNCAIEVTGSGVAPHIFLGNSKFFNLNGASPATSVDAEIGDSDTGGAEITNCILREVTVNKDNKVVNGNFLSVELQGNDSRFVNCNSSLTDDPYGWIIPDKLVGFQIQFVHLANCEGTIRNLSQLMPDAELPHFMIVGHKGSWSEYLFACNTHGACFLHGACYLTTGYPWTY